MDPGRHIGVPDIILSNIEVGTLTWKTGPEPLSSDHFPIDILISNRTINTLFFYSWEMLYGIPVPAGTGHGVCGTPFSIQGRYTH